MSKSTPIAKAISALKDAKVTRCGFAHEHFTPRQNQDGGTEYIATSICNKQKREQLACAHTSARADIRGVLKDAATACPQAEALVANAIQTLQAIEFELIQTDIKKADSEKRLAKFKHEGNLSEQQQEQQIATALSAEQFKYCTLFDDWRNGALQQLIKLNGEDS